MVQVSLSKLIAKSPRRNSSLYGAAECAHGNAGQLRSGLFVPLIFSPAFLFVVQFSYHFHDRQQNDFHVFHVA